MEMGVHSPVPFVTNEELSQMIATQRVVDQLKSGITYSWLPLYGGFMLTKDGPKVLNLPARLAIQKLRLYCSPPWGDLVSL